MLILIILFTNTLFAIFYRIDINQLQAMAKMHSYFVMNAKSELLEILKNTELLLNSEESLYSPEDKKRIEEINHIAKNALNNQGGKISKIDIVKIIVELIKLFETLYHWT